MRKQKELFSVDDMYGCVGVEDELFAVFVAAYLWAVKQVSELDDEKFRKVKKECDAVKIGGDEYFILSISRSMNIDKLNALRDCLNLREYAMIGEKYVHHDEEICHRANILDPNAFEMARKVFQKYHTKEYKDNEWWIKAFDIEL